MAEPGTVSTHVLDTAHGRPAAGMRVDVYRVERGDRTMLKHVETNEDGRTAQPVVPAGELEGGTYELVFHVGPYFAGILRGESRPPFLGLVPVRFEVHDTAQGYHVPLLVSPYGYSTYRGS